ncbi:MAG: hypothetical protein WAM42_16780 [Candidatus Nitrosopolaris sp.]|jgi:hypothetical protein
MKSKTTMAFSTMAIAAVALLFASGPITGNQQALAYGGYGYHHFFFHHHFFHPYYRHFGHFGHFGLYRR